VIVWVVDPLLCDSAVINADVSDVRVEPVATRLMSVLQKLEQAFGSYGVG